MNVNNRIKRIAAIVQHEIAQLIQREAEDPRIKFVTVTDVVVSPDLSHAKIYITTRGDKDVAEILVILKGMAKSLRHQLAQNLQLRKTPELHFFDDEVIRKGQKIDELLKE